MGSRRKAREAAVQMLYQMDVAGVDAERAIELFWENLGAPAEEREFADSLVRGCGARRDQIDDKIRSVSKHWRLERMSRVDRNIIRLGAYELLYVDDVPGRVTLNEAVELAKRFGNEESPAFVNGVLDRIAEESAKRD
ncbi:MAG TPA: transcription antitermination factor NusB [Polyangiales bacterium]|jgi:N utilization substance protein B|nr:transcription antitermination factor NusB [Polyangiales bacterium]